MPAQWLEEYTQRLENRKVNGTTDGFTLADIKTGVLENLRYNSIWLHSSNLNYSADAMKAGVIVFRQAAFLQLDGYSYTGDNVRQHLSTRQLSIIVDTPLAIFYEFIEMDFAMLKDSASLVAVSVGSIIQSLNITMECEWLDMLATTCYATGNVISVDYSQDSTDQSKLNWKMMQLAVNNMKQQFGVFIQGVDTNQMRAIVSPRLAVDIINAFGAIIGTSQAFEALQKNNANSFKLMGLDIIESVLLDTNIQMETDPTQSPYFKLRGFDFYGIQALVAHPIASTLPFNYQDNPSRVNGLGNVELINRFKYGKGVLYPNVITMIKDKNEDGGAESPLTHLVDTIANGTIRGQEAVKRAMGGEKVYHRYVGDGVDTLVAQLKALNITTAEQIKARFLKYENGRIVRPTTQKQDLATLITVLALGELADNTATTILTNVAAKNASANLVTSQLEVADITTTGATVKAKADSTLYTGSVAVTFTLPAGKQKSTN